MISPLVCWTKGGREFDDSVIQVKQAWAATLRQRHIGDFTRWENNRAYRQAFNRLLRDLKAWANSTDHMHTLPKSKKRPFPLLRAYGKKRKALP